MEIQTALNLARNLLIANNLGDWKIRVDKGKRRFGQCRYWKKEIGISYDHIVLNDENKVRETILHEIAHALAPKYALHGPEWQAIAIKLGVPPTRIDNEANIEYRYLANCPLCNRRYRRHNAPNGARYCTVCYRMRGFNGVQRYPLIWRDTKTAGEIAQRLGMSKDVVDAVLKEIGDE